MKSQFSFNFYENSIHPFCDDITLNNLYFKIWIIKKIDEISKLNVFERIII